MITYRVNDYEFTIQYVFVLRINILAPIRINFFFLFFFFSSFKLDRVVYLFSSAREHYTREKI